MKFNLKPLQAALLLAGLSPLASQALVLPLIADTHLAVTNAGTSVAVNVNASNKALLNFDLSTLPAGITSADIAKATLVFFVKTVPTGGQLQVSPLTSAWTENATISTAPIAGLPLATSAPISKGNTSFAVDVTNLVLNWVDVPVSNNGLALDPVGQTSLTFDSKEAIQTSHPAYIEIALKGPAGAVGHTGAVGSQGLQGVPGNSGSNGLNGAPGVNGINGAKGDTGAFPSGTAVGDMQYWDGSQWQIIPPPSPSGKSTLSFCNGVPTWATNCINTTVYSIGAKGPAGGIVFYLSDNTGLHGLEAAPDDINNHDGFSWGCWKTYAGYNNGSPPDYGYFFISKTTVGITETGFGTGAANTIAILTACGSSGGLSNRINSYSGGGSFISAAAAAKTYALNGFTDWYLPSKDELNLLNTQKSVVPNLNIRSSRYWSSTETDQNNAWRQDLVSGTQVQDLKENSDNAVRAIRAF